MEIVIKKSTRKDKKLMAIVGDKKIHFGAMGYEDYTSHRDAERKQRYIARHESNENWTRSGIYSAGFWSRWILWNKPSLKGSIDDLNKRFKDLFFTILND